MGSELPYIQPRCQKIHRSRRCRLSCLWQRVNKLYHPKSCQYQLDNDLLKAINGLFFFHNKKNFCWTRWFQASHCLLHCKAQSNLPDSQLCPWMALLAMDPLSPLQIPAGTESSSAAHTARLPDALLHWFIGTAGKEKGLHTTTLVSPVPLLPCLFLHGFPNWKNELFSL